MARHLFGSTSAVVVRTASPTTQVLTFWTAASGGAQITDLLLAGQPVTQVPTLGGIQPSYQGPDGTRVMWADGGDGNRFMVVTTDPVPVPPVVPPVDLTGYARVTDVQTEASARSVADAGLGTRVTSLEAGLATSHQPFRFTQATPVGTWVIAHGFNATPSNVQVWVGNQEVDTDVIVSDPNTVSIIWASPTAGLAVVSA